MFSYVKVLCKLLNFRYVFIYLCYAVVLLVVNTTNVFSQEINLYTYRSPVLLKPLIDEFTKETGIQVNAVYAKAGIVERLKLEGEFSDADALLTLGLAAMSEAIEADLGIKVESKILNKQIPKQYRPSNLWFGVSKRARVIYVSKSLVNVQKFNYEDLAKPEWKGRICIRSGQHEYNLGLISSLLVQKGEAWTRKWLNNVRDNMARAPIGNDRSQIQGVYSGVCDVAVANSYYYGVMLHDEADPQQISWAKSVRPIFPSLEGKGTHVNISGIMIMKNAPHHNAAIKFAEFLSSPAAQKIYANINYEYPINNSAHIPELLESMGHLKSEKINLRELMKMSKKASILVDEVAFDDGAQN